MARMLCSASDHQKLRHHPHKAQTKGPTHNPFSPEKPRKEALNVGKMLQATANLQQKSKDKAPDGSDESQQRRGNCGHCAMNQQPGSRTKMANVACLAKASFITDTNQRSTPKRGSVFPIYAYTRPCIHARILQNIWWF
mmetsp:Transcript_3398/g.8995  ORF Transcript_3398/g.8995 Transcript_3398/m.8995 type:complete len:139 (-) Transcript_3398:388-804(-)